ncbi:MAG: cation-transporting P-type ATPase, partial [Anaerovoracaceae bacterium]
MQYYLKSTEETLTQLKSQKEGLSETEAQTRMEACGKNKLQEAERESLFHRFLAQMADPMILILIAAAVISGVTSFYAGESFADVIIILAVVIINAVLGVYQESKAEKAI